MYRPLDHGTPPLAARYDILLVEDNPGDARLVREAFRDGAFLGRIHHVEDGVAALDFLRRQPPHEAAPRPDLILLDLNLPRKDGREVLAEVKRDPALLAIPVIVLTTSEAAADVAGAYDRYANCYLAKPVDFDRFLDVIRLLQTFWLTTARLPT